MKKKKLSPEELAELNRQSRLRELQIRIEEGFTPKPTRYFEIGEKVIIGNLQNIEITEVHADGLFYSIFYDYMGEAYGRPERKTGEGIWAWHDIYKINSFLEKEIISVKDDIQIRYYNNDIDSLLHKVYIAGVDFNPDYQRDLVWSEEQKQSLLHSVFNNIEIGKFTFIAHNFAKKRKYYYEILDGKQRLTTLCHFYEDRIKYKGKYLSEMSLTDFYHFKQFPIIQGEVGEITEQQIYKLFIKMNTTGVPMAQEHLEKVKSLIK